MWGDESGMLDMWRLSSNNWMRGLRESSWDLGSFVDTLIFVDFDFDPD